MIFDVLLVCDSYDWAENNGIDSSMDSLKASLMKMYRVHQKYHYYTFQVKLCQDLFHQWEV